jgi:hypothetical protein
VATSHFPQSGVATQQLCNETHPQRKNIHINLKNYSKFEANKDNLKQKTFDLITLCEPIFFRFECTLFRDEGHSSLQCVTKPSQSIPLAFDPWIPNT